MSLFQNDVPRETSVSLSEALGSIIVELPGLLRTGAETAGRIALAREAERTAIPVAERTRNQLVLLALILGSLYIVFVAAR